VRVFENRVLGRILGPKRAVKESGENCLMRSLINYTLHAMYLE
jgi:hypothetical protein